MYRVSREDFEELVGDGVDAVPQSFLDRMTNVVILVEDESPPDSPPLLGLYQGVPLPERLDSYGYGTLPDRITIFSGPLMRMSSSHDDLAENVKVTVVHEIAHHFGIDDDTLHELGWG